MRIQVLGCAGAEMPNHNMPGFLIDRTVLLDAGTIGLALDFQDQRAIEDIFISHAHLDHIKAIPFFADNLVTRNADHTVSVHSTEEVIGILKQNLFNGLIWPDFSLIPGPENPTIRFAPMLTEKTVQLSRHRVTAYHVHHTTPAVGFLVENDKGKRIIYTGDTGPTDTIWKACDEHVLDAVIVEVSFPNRMTDLAVKTGHLTPDLLAREVLKMRNLPLRFFISHSKPSHMEEIYEELAQISREYIEVLQDGQVIFL
ncbi:MAG: 3',5'-cyclic-nucleotide phosphodiesterase [bacterium]|nr:MAG: 3',5'-cyclic-nucleotide phosphodiesterase [bacterium]